MLGLVPPGEDASSLWVPPQRFAKLLEQLTDNHLVWRKTLSKVSCLRRQWNDLLREQMNVLIRIPSAGGESY